jgi:hypothetical protein
MPAALPLRLQSSCWRHPGRPPFWVASRPSSAARKPSPARRCPPPAWRLVAPARRPRRRRPQQQQHPAGSWRASTSPAAGTWRPRLPGGAAPSATAQLPWTCFGPTVTRRRCDCDAHSPPPPGGPKARWLFVRARIRCGGLDHSLGAGSCRCPSCEHPLCHHAPSHHLDEGWDCNPCTVGVRVCADRGLGVAPPEGVCELWNRPPCMQPLLRACPRSVRVAGGRLAAKLPYSNMGLHGTLPAIAVSFSLHRSISSTSYAQPPEEKSGSTHPWHSWGFGPLLA